MSRLSEILGVPEGREFKFGVDDKIYKVDGNRRFYRDSVRHWHDVADEILLCKMIANPEFIRLIPQKPTLTDQQITAIKGRIAESTPWAARDSDEDLYFYSNKPKLDKTKGYFSNGDKDCVESYSDIYSFITYENSPVYLPDLIEGSEGE